MSYPSLHAGYIASVRRMVMDNIVLVLLVKSSCWPWKYPGESPTYTFHEESIYNTRERPTIKLVELSINNDHIVDRCNSQHHISNGTSHNNAQWACLTYPTACSWVSTTHRSYSQLTFFNIFVKTLFVSVVVFTFNRSFYPTTSAAVPPVSFLILHSRETCTNYVVRQWDREKPYAKDSR